MDDYLLISDETESDGIFDFRIQWRREESLDADLSWLGEFTYKAPPQFWYVDRERAMFITKKGGISVASIPFRRDQYPYWIPSSNHNPPGHGWTRPLSKAFYDWLLVRGETPEEADIRMMLEDHAYHERFLSGAWWLQHYHIGCFIEGILVGEDSCGGFDSESVDYHKDLIAATKDMLKQNARAFVIKRIAEIRSSKSSLYALNEKLLSWEADNG